MCAVFHSKFTQPYHSFLTVSEDTIDQFLDDIFKKGKGSVYICNSYMYIHCIHVGAHVHVYICITPIFHTDKLENEVKELKENVAKLTNTLTYYETRLKTTEDILTSTTQDTAAITPTITPDYNQLDCSTATFTPDYNTPDYNSPDISDYFPDIFNTTPNPPHVADQSHVDPSHHINHVDLPHHINHVDLPHHINPPHSPHHINQPHPPHHAPRVSHANPLPRKLKNVQYNKELPCGLKDINTVLKENEDVLKATPGTVAQLLARECMFGPYVMAQCTPVGTKSSMALPQRELMSIKEAMYQQHPCCDPDKFDDVWQTCHTAIEQACGRARRAVLKSN